MNPLTPLELLDILEQKYGFESPSLREVLERSKKIVKLLDFYREKEKLQEERDSININPLDYQQHPLTISIRYVKNQIKALEEELK